MRPQPRPLISDSPHSPVAPARQPHLPRSTQLPLGRRPSAPRVQQLAVRRSLKYQALSPSFHPFILHPSSSTIIRPQDGLQTFVFLLSMICSVYFTHIVFSFSDNLLVCHPRLYVYSPLAVRSYVTLGFTATGNSW